MRKKLIIGILVAVIIGGLFFIKVKYSKNAKNTAVKTAEVVKGDVKSYLSTTAVIKSKNSKDYYGQQLKINSLNVKVGDNVTQGQVLLTYDVADINNSIKQAEIQYNNSVLSKQMLSNNDKDIRNKIANIDDQIGKIDNQIAGLKSSSNQVEAAKSITTLENQKSQLEQTKDNLKPISNEQFKQADNAIELAKINLDSAKAKLSGGKDRIIADFDGVVTAVNVSEGGYGSPSMVAISVKDIKDLKAVVSVGKFDAAKIQLNQSADIKVNDSTVKGKVVFIDPIAQKNISETGGETTLNTEIDILGNPEGLKVDFDTDVNILLGEKFGVIKVPAEAIRSDKTGRNYVFVVENGKAVGRDVKLGLQSDLEAEVIEGIKDGEKVILNPSTSIKNGSPVKENTEVTK